MNWKARCSNLWPVICVIKMHDVSVKMRTLILSVIITAATSAHRVIHFEMLLSQTRNQNINLFCLQFFSNTVKPKEHIDGTQNGKEQT